MIAGLLQRHDVLTAVARLASGRHSYWALLAYGAMPTRLIRGKLGRLRRWLGSAMRTGGDCACCRARGKGHGIQDRIAHKALIEKARIGQQGVVAACRPWPAASTDMD